MLRLKIFLIALTAALISLQSNAGYDAGVSGTVFEIIEDDIRAVIAKDLESEEFKKKHEAHQKEMFNKLTHFEQFSLNRLSEDRQFFFDPSVTLDRDIATWVTNPFTKEVKYHVFGKKGQVINPLSPDYNKTGLKMVHPTLVFDSSDERQLELAKKISKLDSGNQIEFVVTGPHKIDSINKVLKKNVSKFSQGYVDKLKLDCAPAVIAKRPENPLVLSIKCFADPYDEKKVYSYAIP